MNTNEKLVQDFEKKLDDNRVKIEERRAQIRESSGRALTKDRSRWLREAVLKDARRRIAV